MLNTLKTNIHFFAILAGGLAISAYAIIKSLLGYQEIYESHWFNTGLFISEIGGLFLLLANGTFINTRKFDVAKGLLVIGIFGVLIRIMHWPYSTQLINIGYAGISIVYGIHFFQKQSKSLLDLLKLGWVLVRVAGVTLVFYHLVWKGYIMISSLAIMLLAVAVFLIQKRNQS